MKTSYLKFIASLILFGSNGIIAAHITLASDQIVLTRTLIGSLLLIGLMIATKRKLASLRSKRDFAYLVASGAAMGASWLFLYEAYRLVGVGISSLAYYCAPVLVMALSPLLFKERLTAPKIAGFCVVLLGAFLINAQTVDGGGSAWGMACGWLSALMHAAMVVCSKKADQVDGIESSTIQLATSFLIALAFVAFQGGLSFEIAHGEWVWVLTLGLVNTGLGCYLYFSSFGGLTAQTVAVLGYLEPLSAVILSAALLREGLDPTQIAGAALILGGAMLSERRATARRRNPKRAPRIPQSPR